MWHSILASMHAHPFIWGAVSWGIFSNIVSALPAPTEKSSGLYKFVFAFGHGLAMSAARAVAVLWPAFAAKFSFLNSNNSNTDKSGGDSK